MYELEYVRKRKRRKLVAIGAGIASAGISAFAIVAFLGRFVGTFTVSLDTGDVELALSDSSSFKKQSSFLRIDSVPTFQENTYKSLPSDEVLDSEESTYLDDIAANKDNKGKVTTLNYFKYTFYVKNVGKKTARYDMKVKITDNKANKDGISLDDTVRVAIYETDVNNNERIRKDVYAKRAAVHRDTPDGEANYQEPISISEDMAENPEDFPGYANIFESANVIATIPVKDFATDDVRRYTLVTWLEGEDPQSDHRQLAPKGASLKLGVEINAYENK